MSVCHGIQGATRGVRCAPPVHMFSKCVFCDLPCLLLLEYRSLQEFYDRTVQFFAVANFPLYFIEHANQVRVISRAMKLRAEESKNVLFTGFRCTFSFPISSRVRDAIRKIPGKGVRFFFLLQNFQTSLVITCPPILSWEKGVRVVK